MRKNGTSSRLKSKAKDAIRKILQDRHKQYVIAHRCNGFGYKENSLESIRAALHSNADAIEIDIHLTKDNKWVISHDPFYKDNKKSVIRIREKNYEEIKDNVILLDAILPIAAKTRKEIFIDVKAFGCEKALVKRIKTHRLEKQAIIIAWDPQILIRTHKLDNKIRLGLSYVPIHRMLKFIRLDIEEPITHHKGLLMINNEHDFNSKSMKKYSKQNYLSKLPQIGVPLYSIQVYAPFCSTKLVNTAHESKIKVYPFTVDTHVMNTLLKLRRVDGILTNKPKKFWN